MGPELEGGKAEAGSCEKDGGKSHEVVAAGSEGRTRGWGLAWTGWDAVGQGEEDVADEGGEGGEGATEPGCEADE